MKRPGLPPALRRVLRTVIVLLLWEAIGRLHLIGQGALPAPSAILLQMWRDRDVYPVHVWATVRPAMIGFLIGNAAAVLGAAAFVLAPPLERIMRGFNITIFAIPPITLGPLLVIAFSGEMPQIVLAAISVYFPTMIATQVGLRDIDPRPADVIRTYGGGAFAVLRWLRLRSALPALLSGLRIAAPAAVLGAILAEFGSGSRWGLGSFLLGSMGQAIPARLWGIGLTATAVAASGYGVFSLIARGVTRTTTQVTLSARPSLRVMTGAAGGQRAAGLMLTLLSFVMPFLLWQGVLALLNVSPIVAKTPLGVWTYLAASPDAADARAALLSALGQSLPLAILGMFLGLLGAFGLAMIGVVRPVLASGLMPVALLLQTMPLVALTPLIVLVFGRGVVATLVVAVAVTFFPAFITIAQGLYLVPQAALDVLRVYGARPLQELYFVSIPSALPYLCAAARLVAPAALLGVMTAEWLATGYGLGNLLNEARGELDYGMIWSVAFIAVAVSVGLYQIVQIAERMLLRRYGNGD